MDIHNYGRRLDRVLERIKNFDIPEENKNAITEFSKFLIAKSLSIARVEHYISNLKTISKFCNKPFNSMAKDDVAKLVGEIQKNEWSERYKYEFLITIRVFFKWLKQTEEYPEEVKWIRPRYKEKHKIPEEIITEEEIKTLSEKADNLRDKAFILVLYESGCRIGELLTLKIRNVQPVEHGMALTVNGKTGTRRILIISSSPALANWLNLHPYRNNPDSLVWLGIGNRNKNDSLRYHAVLMLLRKLGRLAGIRKRVNPHAFRHARATHLANRLTEAQMKQYFGWTQDSDMAGTYVHLSGRDVDNALLQMHGLAKEDNSKEKILKLKICPRCKEENDPISDFCKRCGSVLELSTALNLEEERRNYDHFVLDFLKLLAKKNPEIKKDFIKLAKEKRVEHLFSDKDET
jgi:site-specific recombinase XerD/ribosomal protein L40E